MSGETSAEADGRLTERLKKAASTIISDLLNDFTILITTFITFL